MNLKLQKEIINHIFNIFGVWNKSIPKVLFNIKTNDFVLPKTITFMYNDEEINNNIYGAQAQIQQSLIKILCIDLSSLDIEEYLLLVQMDDYPVSIMSLSREDDDTGSFYYSIDNKYVISNILDQARILSALEQTSDTAYNWEKLEKYQSLYDTAMYYLNNIE